MAGETLGEVIRRLGRLCGIQDDLAQTDAQLLERFARRGDQPAFAALMARHGPMVFGVCRQLLRDPQEAEDAFQAVFLILARKAGGVRRPALLGGWLHGVAYRVAARLRARTARRREHEQANVDLNELPADAVAFSDMAGVVQEEVGRLPAKYRGAVILCHLEGKTNEEAAVVLRRPVGTVKSRLTRARELLRSRLARRGVVLSGAVIAAALAARPTGAPAALADATIQAAARFAAGDATAGGLVSARVIALIQGVFRTMWLTKTTIAAALALAVLTAGAVGGWVWRAGAGEAPAPEVVAANEPAPADKAADDKDAIQGVWRVKAIETEGKDQDDGPARQIKSQTWTVTRDKIVIKTDVPGVDVQTAEAAYKLEADKTPKRIDITPNYGGGDLKGKTIHAIYSLEGDVLKICRGLSAPEIKRLDQDVGRRPRPFDLRDLLADGGRPTELATKEGGRTTLLTLKREAAGSPKGDRSAEAENTDPKGAKPKDDADAEKIRGTWVAVWDETDGKLASSKTIKNSSLLITADKVAFNPDGENRQFTYKLDPTKTPKRVELTPQGGPATGKTLGGLYELDADRLRLCVQNGDGEEPQEFATKPGTGVRLLVLRRVKGHGNDRSMAEINTAIHEEMQAANRKATEKAASFEYPKAKKLDQQEGNLGVSDAGPIYVALYATTDDVSKVVQWYDKKLAHLLAGQPTGTDVDAEDSRVAVNQDGGRPELDAIAKRPMSTRCYLVKGWKYTVSVVISRPPGEAHTVISVTYMPE